jgi:hypothetical protein
MVNRGSNKYNTNKRVSKKIGHIVNRNLTESYKPEYVNSDVESAKKYRDDEGEYYIGIINNTYFEHIDKKREKESVLQGNV